MSVAVPPSRRRYPRDPIPGRSWKFMLEGPTSKDILYHISAVQKHCGKPVDMDGVIRWLTASTRPGLPINAVAFDSAQDLLLLVHYNEISDPDPGEGVTVYPVRLSDPFAAGYSKAHPKAREAAILMRWEESDNWVDEHGNYIMVDIEVCGKLYALRTQNTGNNRVAIFNWQTGKPVARIDGHELLTDACAVHARWHPPGLGHPHEVEGFTWLAPDTFMITNSHGYMHCEAAQHDGLWIYRIDSRSREPLYRSIALELPRWMWNVRRNNETPMMCRAIFSPDSGSWSEDVFPGALSGNVRNRIVVVRESSWHFKYSLVYIFRNDALLGLLERHNGQTLPYEQWLSRCSRVLEIRGSVERIWVCGWAALLKYKDEQERLCLEIVNFNPEAQRTHMATGVLVTQPSEVAIPRRPDGSWLPFFDGIKSELPYFSTRLESTHGIGPKTDFMMFPDRVLYSNDSWASAMAFYF
ncbi:unnamed protein product [Peniophora sp. CBMAI 1063]|nr:unnamed protein product [Peniophora sp. CBMAI 1063]